MLQYLKIETDYNLKKKSGKLLKKSEIKYKNQSYFQQTLKMRDIFENERIFIIIQNWNNNIY